MPQYLGSVIVGHIGEQLVPVASALPQITGTAQQGQTLTATGGLVPKYSRDQIELRIYYRLRRAGR